MFVAVTRRGDYILPIDKRRNRDIYDSVDTAKIV